MLDDFMDTHQRFRIGLYMLVFAGLIGVSALYAQTSPTVTATSIANQICGVIAIISQVIGVLAIFMFVLGGTLYAFAHFMPASGNIKGSMQGWGMGILMGSIIMLILYLLAPFIIQKLLTASSASLIPAASTFQCNSSGQITGTLGGGTSGGTGGATVYPGVGTPLPGSSTPPP